MPPDLPELTWGTRPGPSEAETQRDTRSFLARCVAEGTLVPGGRA